MSEDVRNPGYRLVSLCFSRRRERTSRAPAFPDFSSTFGRDLSARMMDFASFEVVCDGLLAMVRRDFAPLDGANVAETFVTTRELHVLACPNFSSTSDADSG